MPEQTIKCPKCGTLIPLTEALTGQIEQSIKLRYEAEAAGKAKELEDAKAILARKAKELEAKGEAIDAQVADKVKAERKGIAEAERKKVIAEQSEQTKALEEELAEQNKKLTGMQKQEIDLRKKQREMEQKQQELELENQRKLDEERKKIAEDASRKAVEEQQLKMREKDDQLAVMKKQIDELKRKSEVGSQEAQGEALEQELQEYLERTFPYDRFEEVKKGARGADILQVVHSSAGKECGKILWESKNTKEFQKDWPEKLKKDQQEAGADIAVIMSVALPKGIDGFGQYGGVWVTDYKLSIGLATALRLHLVDVARQKLVTAGQNSVKDILYQYITGQEFTMSIRAVVEAFQRMNRELAKEKNAMDRIWKRREKQISVVIENVAGIYGSVEGLVGGQRALPEMGMLSLESIAEEEEDAG